MLAPSAHLTDAVPVFPPKPVTQRFSGAPGLSAGVLGGLARLASVPRFIARHLHLAIKSANSSA